MRRQRKSHGFTLVEIMIVLAILVLLLAMVGPRLLKTQEKADQKLTLTQIKNMEQALEFYKVDNRSYPSSEKGLKALVEKPADEARATNWDGPYLKEVSLPIDPWGNAFRYEFPPTQGANQDQPNIWSAGPDGKDSTDDDIVNWVKGEGESGEPADNGSAQDLAASP